MNEPKEAPMANLRITRLGHGGVLYRSPNDVWVWVDRWTGAPNYADDYRTPEKVSVYLAGRDIEAVGMNKGGRVEAAGIGFTMVHADHTGGATLTAGDGQVTRDFGCWGWIIEFEDGTTVYHTGDTDVFGDMRLIGEQYHPEVAVLPIGGHYTMGPRDAGMALELIGASTVIPVHYGTFPILAGTPDELRDATDAQVVELEPGETWEQET